MTSSSTEAPKLFGASVQIESLSHSYAGSGRVLDGVSLEVKSGELISVLGPSGCGKSTLLRFLADLEKPTEGKIEFGGSRAGVPIVRGFVFQEPRLLPWRNVLENVRLPLDLNRPSVSDHSDHHPDQMKRAEHALEKVGLSDAMHKFPNQLSGGMKMRVSIARALVLQPSLLLLDEPFSALDESIRHSLQNDLRDLWKSLKMTIVFVTHSIAEAVYLSDRAILFSASPAKVVTDRKIDLPDERNEKLRLSPEFSAEMRKVSELIYSQRAR